MYFSLTLIPQARYEHCRWFTAMTMPTRTSSASKHYSDQLKNKIVEISPETKRVDVVFDIYKEKRLKAQTRDSRGKGLRISDCHKKLTCEFSFTSTMVANMDKKIADHYSRYGCCRHRTFHIYSISAEELWIESVFVKAERELFKHIL